MKIKKRRASNVRLSGSFTRGLLYPTVHQLAPGDYPYRTFCGEPTSGYDIESQSTLDPVTCQKCKEAMK